ncbi:hypothetical protein BJV82DRAFT_614071 [Fennellomyces sp. T-0311]|nr:hypothetical protein BJV82DRAFT_614071 [Fennellomyces sp. T-0311]
MGHGFYIYEKTKVRLTPPNKVVHFHLRKRVPFCVYNTFAFFPLTLLFPSFINQNLIMSEDKYRSKYKELKRRVRDIEDDNDLLHVRIHKARKSINRLRLERTFLLERMEKMQHHGSRTNAVTGDSDHSDIGYEDELYRSNHGKRGRIDKMLKPKKKKDPNAPKGPGNVFFLYCRLERDKIKDEFPQENLGDVTKLLGQKWKGLTKEEKQKYYDMYRKEMEEYEEAMKSYVAGGSTTTVPDEAVVAAAAEDAAAAAAVGISTMSSPTHLSAASPELHSDPIIPPYEDYETSSAGGLATASTTQEVPYTDEAKPDPIPVWRPAEHTKTM